MSTLAQRQLLLLKKRRTNAGIYIYRINCNGGAVGDYAADAFFTGGNLHTYAVTPGTAGLSAPVPPNGVILPVRYGIFDYTFPGLNAAKTHKVRLIAFADVTTKQGAVSINNVLVVPSWMQGENGANTASERILTVAAGVTSINIHMQNIADSATLSAIEVIQLR